MPSTINETNPDGTWKTAVALGINGRGKKRATWSRSIGGRTVVSGEMVTNQVTGLPDDVVGV